MRMFSESKEKERMFMSPQFWRDDLLKVKCKEDIDRSNDDKSYYCLTVTETESIAGKDEGYVWDTHVEGHLWEDGEKGDKCCIVG